MSAIDDLKILRDYYPPEIPKHDAYKRLAALCETFDEVGDALTIADIVRAPILWDSGSNNFKHSLREAADLIRAHVAREMLAKDKRIEELEDGPYPVLMIGADGSLVLVKVYNHNDVTYYLSAGWRLATHADVDGMIRG